MWRYNWHLLAPVLILVGIVVGFFAYVQLPMIQGTAMPGYLPIRFGLVLAFQCVLLWAAFYPLREFIRSTIPRSGRR